MIQQITTSSIPMYVALSQDCTHSTRALSSLRTIVINTVIHILIEIERIEIHYHVYIEVFVGS